MRNPMSVNCESLVFGLRNLSIQIEAVENLIAIFIFLKNSFVVFLRQPSQETKHR